MRIRNADRSKEKQGKLSMTAMIDIVFLLLVFFIMTFKVVAPEGDFMMKMPKIAEADPDSLPPTDNIEVIVQLGADEDGRLSRIQFGQRKLTSIDELHVYVRELVGDHGGPQVSEQTVVFECDYNLKYEHMMEAITAVSGYTDNGRIIKLIENIRFGRFDKA